MNIYIYEYFVFLLILSGKRNHKKINKTKQNKTKKQKLFKQTLTQDIVLIICATSPLYKEAAVSSGETPQAASLYNQDN